MPDICANCTLLAKEPCFLIYMELKGVDVVSELERKNAASANRRKNQPRFRREVLGEEPRCIIVPDGDPIHRVRWGQTPLNSIVSDGDRPH